MFNPITKTLIVRLVLSIALSRGWKIKQFDFNNAFLNGKLSKTVYMSQSIGFVSPRDPLVCKLHKAIYGLKQAPRAWFSKISSTLHEFGFKNTISDPSLFTRITHSSTIYLLVYVDDILVTDIDSHEIATLI